MINILFGGNKKVFNGIVLCVLSIIKHTKKPLNIFILTADLQKYNQNYQPITQDDVVFLNKILKQENINSNATLITLDENFENYNEEYDSAYEERKEMAVDKIKENLGLADTPFEEDALSIYSWLIS